MNIDSNIISLNKIQLFAIIKSNLTKLKEDVTRVRIEFSEEKMVSGQKNKVKIYRVFFNKEEQFADYVAKEATQEEVDSFFE